MAIISVETINTTDEKERCDPSCVVMRWSNSRSVIKIFAKANSLTWKLKTFYILTRENLT